MTLDTNKKRRAFLATKLGLNKKTVLKTEQEEWDWITASGADPLNFTLASEQHRQSCPSCKQS